MLQLENINIESLANKNIILEDAGAYKKPKTKVKNLLRFGRHLNIRVIQLAHYANGVLPIKRENCFRLFITITNQESFYETITNTCSIKDLNWKYTTIN